MTTQQTTTEVNIAVVRRFWQGFNAHNLAVWDEVCAPDFVNHDPGLPTPDTDLPTTKQTIAAVMLAPFPDIQSAEQDLVAEGDKVAVRRLFRGTHNGPFLGVPPTGKPITFSAIFWSRLRDGKIVEQWVNFDALGLLQQLGLVPPLG